MNLTPDIWSRKSLFEYQIFPRVLRETCPDPNSVCKSVIDFRVGFVGSIIKFKARKNRLNDLISAGQANP
jgi:hypothetical protein